jgi:hypothetical protein
MRRVLVALLAVAAALLVAEGCHSSSGGGGGSASTTAASLSWTYFGQNPPATAPTTAPVGTTAKTAPQQGLLWPAGQPFPTFAPAQTYDVSTIGTTNDEMYLLITLQGLVNRAQPRIYFSSATDASLWLTQSNVPSNTVADPMTLVAKYASEVKGIVIYDPNLIDTVNLATTIAGLEGGIVASPALAATLTVAPYNFPVLVDIRTLNLGTALAVYQYELQTYASLTSNRIIVGLDPTIPDCLRDYAVATGAAVVWLDPTDATQVPTLESFLKRLESNAPYMGWWTQEQTGVSLAAQYGVPTYAANYAQNLSALAGVRCTIQPPAPPPPPSLGNKVYVAMFLSDGDNVEEDQNWIPQKWTDPARGQVPISWTVQPAMVDLDPITLAYYWNTATPDDVLVSGPSGLGYTYPGDLSTAALDRYTQLSASYLARAGLRVITVWNNSALPFASGTVADVFALNIPHLLGVTDQLQGTSLGIANRTLPSLQLATAYGNTASDLETGIDGAIAGWSGTSPLFVAVQGDDNQPGMTPSLLLSVAQNYASNTNVVFVRADHLFQLVREANGLPLNP